MSDVKLTQQEAENLLSMLKQSLKEIIHFPRGGDDTQFDAQGDTSRDLFAISIYRGSKNNKKYNFGARIKVNNILLLELHINPGNVHINPNGEKIVGSHWHIYSEEHGRRMAYPAEDVDSEKFVQNTIDFLKKFNVVNLPTVQYQLEIL